jgi:hypothetical protein
MNARLRLLLFLTLTAVAHAASVAVDWAFDPKSGSWANKDTGLSLRKTTADFKLTHADPVEKEGSSSFEYEGARGVITVILEHRVVGGYPGGDDCTPAVRANYLELMHKNYGKTDSERSFRLEYVRSTNRGRGVGTVCHFLSFPDFGGDPAYSEVGAVLIGDYLIEYRGTFVNKVGLQDLNRFLAAVGIKKT